MLLLILYITLTTMTLNDSIENEHKGGHFEDSARGTTQVYILQMYRFLPKPPEYLAQ